MKKHFRRKRRAVIPLLLIPVVLVLIAIAILLLWDVYAKVKEKYL